MAPRVFGGGDACISRWCCTSLHTSSTLTCFSLSSSSLRRRFSCSTMWVCSLTSESSASREDTKVDVYGRYPTHNRHSHWLANFTNHGRRSQGTGRPVRWHCIKTIYLYSQRTNQIISKDCMCITWSEAWPTSLDISLYKVTFSWERSPEVVQIPSLNSCLFTPRPTSSFWLQLLSLEVFLKMIFSFLSLFLLLLDKKEQLLLSNCLFSQLMRIFTHIAFTLMIISFYIIFPWLNCLSLS